MVMHFVALRVVNGDGASYGRLEVCFAGEWGTVCDTNFDWDEANVACNQLGYMGASTYYTDATYGQGCGPIFLAYLDCAGDESRLEHCYHYGVCAASSTSCTHSDDVAVVCNTGGE